MTHKISINDPNLASNFKTLNFAWLEKYFVIEPIDEHVLSHPEEMIEQGGHVLYLENADSVIGCCALKHHGAGVFELTKMAVTEKQQGHGWGKILMNACIKQFESVKGESLYLETNSSLKPAIKLYEKYGFVAKSCPFDTPYQRADYYMEWQGLQVKE